MFFLQKANKSNPIIVQTPLKSVDSFQNAEALKMTQKLLLRLTWRAAY